MSQNSKLNRAAKKKKARRKRNKELEKERLSQQNKSSGPVYTQLKSPFSDLSEEGRESLVSEAASWGEKRTGEILNGLDDVVSSYDPLTLIAIISCYGLTVGVGEDGISDKELSPGLNQSGIELLQAMALRLPNNQVGALPPTPDVVQKVWDELSEIGQAFSFSRMKSESSCQTETDRAVAKIQEMVRNHTHLVRNWGFHSQILSISKELYSPFDSEIEARFGFSATEVISLFRGVLVSVERKLSERARVLFRLKCIKNPHQLVREYACLVEQDDAVEELLEKFDLGATSVDSLFAFFLSHYDLWMSDNFCVDPAEISSELSLSENRVNKILEYYSYSFGDLKVDKVDHLLLENPVWSRPMLEVGGHFYCFVPQLFFSFVLDTLDDLVSALSKKSLHERRAAYLEEKIEEIVKTRFPDSHVIASLRWRQGDAEYENDLVAFIDSHAIIIEAKSQKISRPALRGAPKRIKRHLDEILIEPNLQSHRLEKRIDDLRQSQGSRDDLLEQLPVDIASINKVLHVSVSLEYFATLQTNMHLFEGTGWLPQGFKKCPSMNLADFQTLFDFLEHPVQIIDYLTKRSEIEDALPIVGDELDFMGLYSETLLNLDPAMFESDEIMISGMSAPLDKYYISRENGHISTKPEPKISPFFKDIFHKLEKRGTPRWTEIGAILNRFPPDHQEKIASHVARLEKVVRKRWEHEGHHNTAVYVPPEPSEYALSVTLYTNKNTYRANEFFDSAAVQGLEPDHVKYCLVIAINIDLDSPYDRIAVLEKREL